MMTLPSGIVPVPWVFKTQPIQSGVRNTPMRLDRVALKTAAGTLPRAAEVIATDDDTVEGRAHKKKKPMPSVGEIQSPVSASRPRPSRGNNKNVADCTTR